MFALDFPVGDWHFGPGEDSFSSKEPYKLNLSCIFLIKLFWYYSTLTVIS